LHNYQEITAVKPAADGPSETRRWIILESG
jgi:hypothetical protein